MKRTIILSMILLVLSLSSYAQFKIISNGEVRLWTSNMGPWDNSMITYANHDYSKSYVVDRNGTHVFYARGDGWVLLQGTLTRSDFRLKKNINNVETVNDLFRLQAKSYNYISNSDSDTRGAFGSRQYGFIAQEVKEIYPELVSEDEDGMLSINYTAFIPLLIEVVKQQKEQIESLSETINSQEQEIVNMKKAFDNCCEHSSTELLHDKPTAIDDIQLQNAKLYQNVPNPFSFNTEIRFEIPENSNLVKLIIYNLQGSELKKIDIMQKGSGSVVISGSEFEAGRYLYSLMIDNVLIDTKRMVLTKE